MGENNSGIAVGSGHGVNYLSLVTVVSTIAVIFLHVNNAAFWTYSAEPRWISADIIESLFYFAVPCFFMVSGATLIGYRDRYSTAEFFKKRFFKTVVPFIAWSLIAFAYLVIRRRIDLGSYSPGMLLDAVLGYKLCGYYWFFPVLFVIYLCLPLFSAVQKDLRKSVFSYLAVIGFVCMAVVPFMITLSGIEMSWPFSIPVVAQCLLYSIIGYLLNTYEVSRRTEYLIYIAGIVGFLIHVVGTYVLSSSAGELIVTCKGYENVPCIMFSVAVFLFFKQHHGILSVKPISKLIGFLSPYAFSVYLMHWFFIDFFWPRLGGLTLRLSFRILAPFVLVAVCVLVAFVIKKIPGLRKILP